MLRSIRIVLATAVVLTALTAALGGCGDDAVGTLVVGVTSDLQVGSDIDRLTVRMSVDGEVLSDQSLALGSSAGKTDFPAEFSFNDVAEGSSLTFHAEAYAGDALRVVRHMETTAVADGRRLVHINLDNACVLRDAAEVTQTGIDSGPTCNETSQTCIAGNCADASVATGQQEPYKDDWADAAGDVCKPSDAGAPEVIVGQGQSDYLMASNGDVAQVEAGPQGGHHIWVSARVKNLRQRGSITEVGGELPSLGLSISPLKVIFTLEQDEGGYCKIYGLRFQLDIDGDDVNTMLGEQARVIVSVTDSDDDVGSGELMVTLSDDIAGL